MAEPKYVKYCPLCGKENDIYQAFCGKCGDGDLSSVSVEVVNASNIVAEEIAIEIAPSAEPEVNNTAKVNEARKIVIESIDDPTMQFIVQENQSVGRNNKAEVIVSKVAKSEWISGRHALFTRRGEKWYIQHVGKTNYIIVDNEKFSEDEEVPIYNDSIIALSLSLFRVKIK